MHRILLQVAPPLSLPLSDMVALYYSLAFRGFTALHVAIASPLPSPCGAVMHSELMVNITKHELVPQHIPLSDDEKKEFLHSQCVCSSWVLLCAA